ncbi:MAG: hypothetical protein WC554_01830 [Clostridia bacterium]
MKIQDLPKDIQKLALANQAVQGNCENLLLAVGNDKKEGNFTWDATSEGYDFWEYVSQGRFVEAREFLPKSPIENIVYTESEVIRLLQQYRFDLSSGKTPTIGDTVKEWFEQNKK